MRKMTDEDRVHQARKNASWWRHEIATHDELWRAANFETLLRDLELAGGIADPNRPVREREK